MTAKASASLSDGGASSHRNALRELAAALPAGAAVPVPREWLLDLLGDTAPLPDKATADLTAAGLALHFKRRPSTVRGWIEAGMFPGAYRFRGREWRVTAAGLAAFEESEREHRRGNSTPQSTEGATGLRGFLKGQR